MVLLENLFFLKDEWKNSKTLNLYSDASGNAGLAAVFGSWCFAESWPSYLKEYQITIKELFPIVVALELWGKHLQNSKVMFFSDNQAVVEVINKQSCKDKVMMSLVRRMVLTVLTFNIVFRAKHIAGKSNVTADHLSRFHFQKARQLAPWLAASKTTIQDHLMQI